MSKSSYSLEDIAKLYPLLYSQKHIDEWFNLFDESALVVRVEDGQPITCLNIREAMPEQWEYANENSFFNEEWEQVEIYRFGNVAVIKANYILTVDFEIRKGVDVLTLCRDHQGWRIINLTYEQKEFVQK
jgi:hypothetical protein